MTARRGNNAVHGAVHAIAAEILVVLTIAAAIALFVGLT